MFDGLMTFLNEQPLAMALIASIMLVALGQLLSWTLKKVSAKRKRSRTSTSKRSKPESNSLFSAYLSDFRILTEPAPNTDSQREPVAGTLTIGYELNREWVTVSYEGQDILIGSGSSCELRLPAEDGVQELHAVVCRAGTQFYLQPNQKSIILLNGRRVKTPISLTDGKVMTLGNYNLTFFLEG